MPGSCYLLVGQKLIAEISYRDCGECCLRWRRGWGTGVRVGEGMVGVGVNGRGGGRRGGKGREGMGEGVMGREGWRVKGRGRRGREERGAEYSKCRK